MQDNEKTLTPEEIIGFSTGAFHPRFRVREALPVIASTGCRVVELGPDLVGEADVIRPDELAPFSYVSLHAPKRNYGRDAQTRKLFSAIGRIHEIRPLNLVVFHPDTISDFSLFRDLPYPVAFENMDCFKKSYINPRQMAELLAQDRRWGFVLDAAHIFSNDPTMKLADAYDHLLGDRIVEFHVSGFTSFHEPLIETDQAQIVTAIRRAGIPIIIESQIQEPENLLRERDYVLQSLPRAVKKNFP